MFNKREYYQKWNADNADKLVAYRKKAYDKKRQMMDELKDRPCDRCGYEGPPRHMDWHHRDPATKEIELGGKCLKLAWTRVLAEVEKCDLLCKFCHADVHWEERNGTDSD